MRILDVNLLLYAVNRGAAQHETARRWLEARLAGDEAVGFPWVVLLAFLRLSTKPGVFGHPLSAAQAWDLIDTWMASPAASVVHPGHRHGEILKELTLALGTTGNLTTDAHLAALALENGAELCSADADFARFPGLRWTNPLAAVPPVQG